MCVIRSGDTRQRSLTLLKKKRDFGGERSRVQVGLIQYHVTQGGPKELLVLRPAQHILQHGVVGDDDVRNARPRGLTASAAAGIPLSRLGFTLRSVSGVSLVKWKRLSLFWSLKKFVKPSNLIGDQGVHGVEDQAPHALLIGGARLLPKAGENRQQESFGLARAGPSGDHERRLLDRIECSPRDGRRPLGVRTMGVLPGTRPCCRGIRRGPGETALRLPRTPVNLREGLLGKAPCIHSSLTSPPRSPAPCQISDGRTCQGWASKIVFGYGEIDKTLPRHLDKLKGSRGVDLAQNLLLSTNRMSNEAVRNWRPLQRFSQSPQIRFHLLVVRRLIIQMRPRMR